MQEQQAAASSSSSKRTGFRIDIKCTGLYIAGLLNGTARCRAPRSLVGGVRRRVSFPRIPPCRLGYVAPIDLFFFMGDLQQSLPELCGWAPATMQICIYKKETRRKHRIKKAPQRKMKYFGNVCERRRALEGRSVRVA